MAWPKQKLAFVHYSFYFAATMPNLDAPFFSTKMLSFLQKWGVTKLRIADHGTTETCLTRLALDRVKAMKSLLGVKGFREVVF